jgi:hypothetical protein
MKQECVPSVTDEVAFAVDRSRCLPSLLLLDTKRGFYVMQLLQLPWSYCVETCLQHHQTLTVFIKTAPYLQGCHVHQLYALIAACQQA